MPIKNKIRQKTIQESLFGDFITIKRFVEKNTAENIKTFK